MKGPPILMIIAMMPLGSLSFMTRMMLMMGPNKNNLLMKADGIPSSSVLMMASSVEDMMENIFVFHNQQEEGGKYYAVYGREARDSMNERGDWKEIDLTFVSSMEDLPTHSDDSGGLLNGKDNDDEEDEDEEDNEPVNEQLDIELQKALMEFYQTEEERYETLKGLVEGGASIKRTRSMLRVAADSSRNGAKNLRVLLDLGGNIHDCDAFGSTPLHIAAVFSNVEVISILLEQGARLEQKDNDGLTPKDVYSKTVERNQDMEMEVGTKMPKAEQQKQDRILEMFSKQAS